MVQRGFREHSELDYDTAVRPQERRQLVQTRV